MGKRSPSIAGTNLKRIREARRITQKALAERLGLDPESGRVYIARVERGDVQWPTGKTLRAMADALGVTVGELAPPETGEQDLERLIEAFRGSAWAQTLKPPATDADFAWLRTEGRVMVLGDRATPETIHHLIQAFRSLADPVAERPRGASRNPKTS